MPEPAHVLDASALLAVMLGEPGWERIEPLLADSIVGAVNLSEVVAKLQERGVPDSAIDESLAELGLAILPFDADQAVRAGKLRTATRASGLSPGDRACLALAAATGATAVTTDRQWASLDTGIAIRVVR